MWRKSGSGWLEDLLSKLPMLRRRSAALGVGGMLLLGGLKPGFPANSVALAVFILLLFSAVAVLFELKGLSSSFRVWTNYRSRYVGRKKQVLAAIFITGVFPAAAIQTWFQSNSAIAGGDVAPPNGTAWIAHMFAPWIWSGSNLGAPGTLETYLPWAVVLQIVHSLGGSAALAQRIWLTALFSAAALLALAVLMALGLRPFSGTFGALSYLFNAYFVSSVGLSAVYVAALVLLPGMIALVLWVARGRLRIMWGCLIFLLSAPLFGYTSLNPPLLGVSMLGVILSVPLAGYLGGQEALRRALRLTAIGVPLLIFGSAYWIIPSQVQVSVANLGQISSISSWAWTEGRETLRNGFWLNDTWGWIYPAYFPFARTYSEFPLNVLRFVFPAAAFGMLALPVPKVSSSSKSRTVAIIRFGSVVSLVALFVVLISTGTNAPGAPIFKLLYSAPYGWLLQGPGRFLYFAGLCYAVLVAITAEWYLDKRKKSCCGSLARKNAAWYRFSVHYVLPIVAFSILVAPAYPMLTGAIAPSHRSQGLPGVHVHVPHYWSSMADFLNTKDAPGNLLLLPPDAFYQVQYNWGYYGNDGFIYDMIGRNVVDVAPATYFSVNQELYDSEELLIQALLSHDWILATRLLQAFGTSQLLVRGDLVLTSTSGGGSPSALTAALTEDPFVRLIRRDGPLYLYGLSTPMFVTTSTVYAIGSSEPMLQVLSLLPPGAALVTEPASSNMPMLVQSQRINLWNVIGKRLSTSIFTPAADSIQVSEIDGINASPLQPVQAQGSTAVGPFTVTVSKSGSKRIVAVSEPLGAKLLSDGKFSSGFWNTTVGDCNNHGGKGAAPLLHQSLSQGGGPSGSNILTLSAAADSACESKSLNWHSGPVRLDLWVRHIAGAQPRVCLWEVGPNRCAATPLLPKGSDWKEFKSYVQPDPGTSRLALVLYTDAAQPGSTSANQFADLSVRSVPTFDRLVFLFKPLRNTQSSETHLVIADSTWSSYWQGVPTSKHVLVDGLRNGWVSTGGLSGQVNHPRYAPTLELFVSDSLSLVTALGVLSVVIFDILRSRKFRRRLRSE